MKKTSEKTQECVTMFSWKRIFFACGGMVVLCFGVFGGCVLYTNGFEDKVIPGVVVDGTPVGGMTKQELRDFLYTMNDRLVEAGARVQLGGATKETAFTLYPVIVTDGGSIDLFSIDVEKEVDTLVHIGKRGDIFTRIHNIFTSNFSGYNTTLRHVTANTEKIDEVMGDFLARHESPPVSAKIKLSDAETFAYTIEPEQVGHVYNRHNMSQHIVNAWKRLRVPETIILTKEVRLPQIVSADLAPLQEQLQHVFNFGSLTLVHTDPENSSQRSWELSKEQLAEWVATEINDEGGVIVSLDPEAVSLYVEENIAKEVDIAARDAKFAISEDGGVAQFQQSRPGLLVDREKTTERLLQVFAQRSAHQEGVQNTITVITKQKEPMVSTRDSNNLGITEVIGVGVSSYAGSPTNRIKNIRNAVNKLNGVLIGPGEEFSTIDYTKPYTEEGGYLAELVIKGDEIKPEIGGGLCQIGTTLFRMAMMSGLEITERRNHSLVVGYYNDARNGLPGTDATIYEPAPDFRFKNDTQEHVLIETAMDTKNQDLIFTLWGASDGRVATYTKPEVRQWIPHGETRIVETTKIAPGKRECQSAFKGANTSFTYSRTLASGVTEDIVYESHYRPLPEICLVGVEEEVVIEDVEVQKEVAEQVEPDNPFGNLEL